MSDLISRQAAIDAMNTRLEDIKLTWRGKVKKGEIAMYLDMRGVIETVPPAETEIIRCTECKHYREYDSEYVENAVVVQCMADRYPISETIPDGWFCAGAERKDDE